MRVGVEKIGIIEGNGGYFGKAAECGNFIRAEGSAGIAISKADRANHLRLGFQRNLQYRPDFIKLYGVGVAAFPFGVVVDDRRLPGSAHNTYNTLGGGNFATDILCIDSPAMRSLK